MLRVLSAIVGPLPLATLYHAYHSLGRGASPITEYVVAALSFWFAMAILVLGRKVAPQLLFGREFIGAATAAGLGTLAITTILFGWSGPLRAPFWFSLAMEFWGIFIGLVLYGLIRRGRLLKPGRAGT